MAFAEGKDKEALQRIDPLIKKGTRPFIPKRYMTSLKAIKTKNETLVKQGLNAIRDLATKAMCPRSWLWQI